jgi:LPPG:FO 2-phospho-L-lactate transferase
MKVVALAGGVGGAKLADGLAQIMPPEDLTIIVNTGDDFQHFGLYICPDLDTVCYTLAGLANPATGWGRAGESWRVLQSLVQLGGPDWFGLGDRDLGTHLERSRRLREGQPLSQITRDFCKSWGIGPTVLPMSDDPIPTIVLSDEGELPFQEYFVHRRCEPRVSGFRFQGVEAAEPALGVVTALREAALVVVCPSNPWVSIGPILAVPTLKSEIEARLVVAVSPIIAGKAVKGPVVKMYAELGIRPSALAVAEHYQGLLDGFVMDNIDIDLKASVERLNIHTLIVDTLMQSPAQRKRLAQDVLKFGKLLVEKE